MKEDTITISRELAIQLLSAAQTASIVTAGASKRECQEAVRKLMRALEGTES